MNYLLDTDVLSATAPTKAVDAAAWRRWLVAASDRLFLSAVTIAEIEHGIVAAERLGATTKAGKLRVWLTAVTEIYGDRILAFDRPVAVTAGRMLDSARGHAMGFADIAIAATAATHGLTLLTANRRDFRPLGVDLANPFEALPPL
ncbi:MAG: VapC toxin family PIN domain ribonuclease [Chelatococcus sp.]|nr:MAG: VapC toxin family PIN domain ribonuclease [Chelatococcus sp.]